MKTETLVMIGLLGVGAYLAFKPGASIPASYTPKGTISEKLSLNPWTVGANGYTYDAAGRLILDDAGNPIAGTIDF